MQENLNNLSLRVLDTLSKTDLEYISNILSNIKDNTICSGVGGSKVVSDYASLILTTKNKILTTSIEPHSISNQYLSLYDNVLLCSYSGNNYGSELAFSNNLHKYLLSTGTNPSVTNLTYLSSLPKEHSFISLAATLMPMSILLAYYLDNDISVIEDIISKIPKFSINSSNIYEIIASRNPSAPEEFLNSTLTESGIAIPLIHGKYGYCHGRTTISKYNDSSVIHFYEDSDLDHLLKEELPKYYNQVITLKSLYQDPIIDKFYLTYLSIYLAASIAKSNNKDLSSVDYSPLVKKLYRFKGGI